jgi:hypothetical protein
MMSVQRTSSFLPLRQTWAHDGGKTWTHHTVITDSGGFNTTALREVSPGRLLYVHDAPNLRAL